MGYIYALVDPREPDDIRYIGWTTQPLNKRLAYHVYSAKRESTHKSHWIAKLLRDNVRPQIVVIEEVNHDSWKEREKHWIAYYREHNPHLTNTSDGGESSSGVTPSESTKDKIRQKLIQYNANPDVRQRKRKELIEKNKNPVFVQRANVSRSKRMIQWNSNPEHREISRQAASNGLRLYFENPDNRIKRSEQLKKQLDDPTFVERRDAAAHNQMKQRMQDPAYIENVKAASHSSSANTKRSTSMKATWARKQIVKQLDVQLDAKQLLLWQDDGGST